MSEIVDRAVVELVAKTGDYVNGMRNVSEQTSRTSREVSDNMRRINDSTREALRTFAELAGIGLGVGKLVQLGKAAVEGAEHLGKLSTATGASVTFLQELQLTAENTATSIDAVGNSFKFSEKAATEAVSGNKQAAEAYRALGLSVSQVQELMRDPDALYAETVKRFAQLNDGVNKASLGMAIFGRGYMETAGFIAEAGTSLDETRERAHELGIALSELDNKKLLAIDDAGDKLNATVHGLANRMMVELSPALVQINEEFTKALADPAVREGLRQIGDGAQFVAAHIGEITSAARDLVAIRVAQWAIDSAKGLADMSAELAKTGAATVSTKNSFALLAAGVAGWGLGGVLREKFAFAKQAAEVWVMAMGVDFEIVKAAWQVFTKSFSVSWDNAVGVVETKAANFARTMADLFSHTPGMQAQAQYWDKFADKIERAAKPAKDLGTELRAITDASSARVREIVANADKQIAMYEQEAKGAAELAKGVKGATEAVKEATKYQSTYNAGLSAGSEAAKKIADSEQKLVDIYANAAGVIGGPLVDALAKREALERKVADAVKDALEAGASAAEVDKLRKAAMDALHAAYDIQVADITQANHVLANYTRELREQGQTIGLTEQELRIYSAAQAVINGLIQRHVDLNGDYVASEEELRAKLEQSRGALEGQLGAIIKSQDAYKAAIESAKQVADATHGLFTQLGTDIANTAAGVGGKWKDLGKTLVQDTKQFVAKMLLEIAELKLIQPFMASLFGGLSGVMGSSGTGSAGGGLISMFSGLMGGGGAGTAGGTGGVGGMFGGYGGLASTVGGWFGLGGGATAAGAFGPMAAGYAGLGASTAAPSLVGAGGAFTVPSAAAPATYGAGAGSAASSSAMIPVIGWIVAAVMANISLAGAGWRGGGGNLKLPDGQQVHGGGLGVTGAGIWGGTGAIVSGLGDRLFRAMGMGTGAASVLSGSALLTRLFGHQAPHLTGQTVTGNFGEGGVNTSALFNIREKGGIFSSDKNYTKSGAASAEAVAAMADFFKTINAVIKSNADALKTDAAPMVDAAFRTVIEYTKKGAVKATHYFVDILGKTYEEASAELGQMRIVAENTIAQVGASASDASAIAEQWRSSAELLAAGAQFLLHAQADINNAHALIQDESLTQLTAFVQSMSAAGEALDATYARISEDNNALTQSLAAIGGSVASTGEAFVKLSVDLANSLGGADAVRSAFASYANNYLSAQERIGYALASLHETLITSFDLIGEDATESMAQFRDRFENALPTMSAEDLANWLKAADDLATYTHAVTDSAAAIANANLSLAIFKQGLRDVAAGADSAASMLLGMDEWITQQLADADRMEQALGRQGATADDVALVMQAAATRTIQAMRAMEVQAQQLAESLYGTNLEQLTAKLQEANANILRGGVINHAAIEDSAALQQQIADAIAGAEAQKRNAEATALAHQIAAIDALDPARTWQDIAQQMHVPLDKFAQDLGLSGSALSELFTTLGAQETAQLDMVAAQLHGNELLSMIAGILGGYDGRFIRAPGRGAGDATPGADVVGDAAASAEASIAGVTKVLQTTADRAQLTAEAGNLQNAEIIALLRQLVAKPAATRSTTAIPYAVRTAMGNT